MVEKQTGTLNFFANLPIAISALELTRLHIPIGAIPKGRSYDWPKIRLEIFLGPPPAKTF